MIRKHLAQVNLQWKNIFQLKEIIIINIIIPLCTNEHLKII
jgi:hypothetical protein